MNLDFKHFGINSFFTDEFVISTYDKLLLSPNHQFSPKRMADFSTGRYCAMKAIEQLGIQDAIIPIGDEREPIWPEGIVGSISHCDILTGAIVAKSSDHISLGLDIEEIGRVTPDLWDLVFSENEKAYLAGLSGNKRNLESTKLFSIKEAFYKFQFPITKIFLDFLEVEIILPTCEKVFVNSQNISLNSSIRMNRSFSYEVNDCVITLLLSV